MTHQQLIDKPLKPCIPHFEWLWPWVINPSELSAWFMKAESCCQEIPRFSAGLEPTAQQTPVWLWIKTLYIPLIVQISQTFHPFCRWKKKVFGHQFVSYWPMVDVPSGSNAILVASNRKELPWFFLGLSHFQPFPSISIHFHSFPFISIHFHPCFCVCPTFLLLKRPIFRNFSPCHPLVGFLVAKICQGLLCGNKKRNGRAPRRAPKMVI